MNIAVFHNGGMLGKYIVDMWNEEHGESDAFQLVDNCSLDEIGTYSPKLVVLASDIPSEFEKVVLGKCREFDLSVLPVWGRGTAVLIGPLETPGISGCATCLQLRFENTFERLLHSIFDEDDPLEMSAADLSAIGRIVIEEIHLIVSGSPKSLKFPNSKGNVGVYDEGNHFAWVPVVPSHDCPRCDLVPDDDPLFATLQFASHTVSDVEALRIGTVDFKRLEASFVHTRVGYISQVNTLRQGNRFMQADAYIYMPDGSDIAGYGAGTTSVDAKQSAMLEVLERSCGCRAIGRRPVVRDTYLARVDDAIHPSKFGLQNPLLLDIAAPIFAPFDEENTYSWVWAYSTKRHKPVLIPEQIGYYGPISDDGKRFVFETSNGCAIGSTIEEAALHGIFEVLERDGFLNMWYGKMAVPELCLGPQCSSKVTDVFRSLEESGFEVRLFRLSHDLDIPNLCAVAINRENDYPKVVSGSSCHINPYEAAYGALRELTVQVNNLQRVKIERREEAASMLCDSRRIKAILDHVAVGALPEVYVRWDFLLTRANRKPVQSVEEAFADIRELYRVKSRDIRVILEALLDDLHGRGFDVIVLDQTSVEVAYGGLHAVKVLIPGMTPITFGHGFERFRGLSRVFELPLQMGYSARLLTEGDLNQDCHPFS